MRGAQPARRVCEPFEGLPDVGDDRARRFRQYELVALPLEERAAEVFLEAPHLLADCSRRDGELMRCAHVRAKARGGFERAQCVEMGESRMHEQQSVGCVGLDRASAVTLAASIYGPSRRSETGACINGLSQRSYGSSQPASPAAVFSLRPGDGP